MIEEKGFGKVNLGLRIIRRRDDGYHEIDTIFQSIGLYDTIRLERAETFSLTCSEAALSCDSSNLAYRAYAALCAYTGRTAGVHIHLQKAIPLAAGLAGGSTDCAAVLRGLNRLWDLQLSLEELAAIGASLGADVPFCVYGGTMRGRGVGEQLEPLRPLPSWPLLVLHPAVAVHTQSAYALFSQLTDIPVVPMEALSAAVQAADLNAVQQFMGNTFAYLVPPKVPAVTECYDILRRQGLQPLMSGSGPTTFALVPPERDIQAIYDRIRAAHPELDIYQTTLVGGDTGHANSESART